MIKARAFTDLLAITASVDGTWPPERGAAPTFITINDSPATGIALLLKADEVPALVAALTSVRRDIARQLRARGWSQERAGAALGVHHKQIHRWERS